MFFFYKDVTEIRRPFPSNTLSPVAHTEQLSPSVCCAALLGEIMREELARLLDGLTGTVRFDNADPRWVTCFLADCFSGCRFVNRTL